MIRYRSEQVNYPSYDQSLVFSILLQELGRNSPQLVDDGRWFVESRDVVVLADVNSAVKACTEHDQSPDDAHLTTRNSDSRQGFEEAEDFEAVDQEDGSGHERQSAGQRLAGATSGATRRQLIVWRIWLSKS